MTKSITKNVEEDDMAEKQESDKSKNQKQQDDEQNVKVMSALAYFGILFFLPLVVTPESKFGKFHANQGLLLLILGVANSFLWVIPIIGWLLAPFVSLAILVLFIMGILNAVNGEMKRLPLIGGYDLIK